VLAEAIDGTAVFLHWWDSELEEECTFEPVDEPEASFRCLPRSAPTIYEGAGEMFADARCSQRLLAELTDGPRVVQLMDMNCWLSSAYFRRGAQFTGGTTYRKTEQDCIPEPAPADAELPLYVLEPMPIQVFVGANLLAAESAGAVAPNYLSAEDGSREPHGLSDVTGGFDCWPRKTSEGMRCLPTHIGWGDRGGVYTDARCSVPAAWPEVRCNAGRNTLPFVLFESSVNSGTVTAVHRGGARLSNLFVQLGASCSAANPETTAFGIDQPMDLGSFLPASLLDARRASGLVQTVAQVGSASDATDAVTIARFDELASDALGGYDCMLAVTSDGSVRCVPSVSLPVRTDYADASCTQPVWETPFDRMSVGSERIDVEVPDAGRIVLPRVDRVLTGGTPYMVPVYALRGTDCALLPNVPNARQPYHRFTGEARLTDLPALPIVVR